MDRRLDPASRPAPASRRGHERPRVLDLATSLDDPSIALRTAEMLQARGFDVRLVSGGVDPAGVAVDIGPRVAHTFIPWLGRDLGFGDDLRALAAIAGIVRRWRPDVIHTRHAKAGMLGRTAALRSRVPVFVHTVEDPAAPDPAGIGHGAAIQRRLAARADALIAPSLDRRDDLLGEGIGRPTQWHVVSRDGETAFADLLERLLGPVVAPGRAAARIGSSTTPGASTPQVAAVAAAGGRG